MPESNPAAAGVDPLTRMWTEMMGRMAGVGAAGPTSSPDMLEHMRKTFFAALAEQADQFMRSEQFLAAMKQTLDNSLALRQQMNQFLTTTLQASQMPSRSDTDHIVLLLRGVEDRLVERLEDLAGRIDRLEAKRNGAAKKAAVKVKPKPPARRRGQGRSKK